MTQHILADFDTCTCGDYRYAHEDYGRGQCKFNASHRVGALKGLHGVDGHHGAGPCLAFELDQPASEVDPNVEKWREGGSR